MSSKRVVAIIPARGGSKSVPKKNIRELGGKPLIAWPIAAARDSGVVDRTIVSTDDAEIAQIARSYGSEVYMRPSELAGDASLVVHAIQDLIRRLRIEGETAEVGTLLEPTCPFRSPEDVAACVRKVTHDGFESAATFMEAKVNPARTWIIRDGVPSSYLEGSDPWQPRQSLKPAFQLTGGAYAFLLSLILESRGPVLFGRCAAILVPTSRSLDIDDEVDFATAEAWLKLRTQ